MHVCMKKKDGRTGMIIVELPKEPINDDLLFKLRRSRDDDKKIISWTRIGFILTALFWIIYSGLS